MVVGKKIRCMVCHADTLATMPYSTKPTSDTIIAGTHAATISSASVVGV